MNETLITLMDLAKAHLDEALDQNEQLALNGAQKESEEERFRSSVSYLAGTLRVFAKTKCSDVFSSIFLYRVYSGDYYSRRLQNRYGVPRNFSITDLLLQFNRANKIYSESVCMDFIFYLECLHHRDSFGLFTIEHTLLC